MRHAERTTQQRRAAYNMARRYAEQGEAGMMELYVLQGKEHGGFTPKQLERLRKLLRENSAWDG